MPPLFNTSAAQSFYYYSYNKYDFLLKEKVLGEKDKKYYDGISSDSDDTDITISLRRMSNYLYQYYGRKAIILLDEYDTPMQEAYVNGYWEELTAFTRSLFNAAFKGNPYLERAIMTGITRISKESIFSDLNNLEVVTTTSDKLKNSTGKMKCHGCFELDHDSYENGIFNLNSPRNCWKITYADCAGYFSSVQAKNRCVAGCIKAFSPVRSEK